MMRCRKIAKTEDDLNRLLFGFEKTAKTYNWIISPEKIQSIVKEKEPN